MVLVYWQVMEVQLIYRGSGNKYNKVNGLEVNIKPLLSPLYYNNYDFDSLASIVSVRSGMLELAKHQRKDVKLRPIITSL